jgi:hypothetical protein
LNAKTGKPMNNKMVTFAWSDRLDESVVAFNKEGLGTVVVPAGVHKFTLLAGPRVGDEPYRIPFVDCNAGGIATLQVSMVLEKGYAPRNACGDKSAVAHPGEIVFWALPLSWWRPDFQ